MNDLAGRLVTARGAIFSLIAVICCACGGVLEFIFAGSIDSVLARLSLWAVPAVLGGFSCILVHLLFQGFARQQRTLGIASDALYQSVSTEQSRPVPTDADQVYDALLEVKQVVDDRLTAAELLSNFNHAIANESNWQKVLEALNHTLMSLAKDFDKSVVFRFGEKDSSHYRIDKDSQKAIKQRLRLSDAEEAKLYRLDNGQIAELSSISPTLAQCQPNFASPNCALFRLSGDGGGYGFIFLCVRSDHRDPKEIYAATNSLAQLAGAALSRCERESNLYRQANYDSLTGLPNRILLEDRTTQALRHAKRYQHRVGLMFIDLDGFKRINDSLGHSAGDKLLQGVADRLRTCIRESDTVARLAGDEFVVLVSEIGDSEQSSLVLGGIAKTIQSAIARPFELSGKFVRVTPSVGVAISSKKADSYETLLQAADTAMYTAKSNGEGTIRFFQKDMSTTVVERMSLETELALAIDKDQLSIEYQPQIDLESGQLVGVESLLRWDHPNRGRISPARFIPLAEDSGIMSVIGNWALRRALRDAAAWQADGVKLPVAINLSAAQLKLLDITQIIERALTEYNVDPGLVCLEISESTAMHDTQYTTNVLGRLKALGVRLALDDFGTSYSSLAYLSAMPVNGLKIDKRFIDDLSLNNSAKTVIDAIVGLGHGLGLEIIAEGVEQEVQQRLLTDAACDIAQGYLYSEPLTRDAMLEFVDQNGLKTKSNIVPFPPKLQS